MNTSVPSVPSVVNQDEAAGSDSDQIPYNQYFNLHQRMSLAAPKFGSLRVNPSYPRFKKVSWLAPTPTPPKTPSSPPSSTAPWKSSTQDKITPSLYREVV